MNIVLAIFTSSRFLFSMGIAIFLVSFFALDEAATIFIQAMYFFILFWHILSNMIIVGLATIVFVFVSLIATSLDFIPNSTPDTVLINQSLALQGSDALFMGFYLYIEDVSVVFEQLLGVEISYYAGQSPFDAIGIVVSEVIVSVQNVTEGAVLTIVDILTDLGILPEGCGGPGQVECPN